jgi:Glutamate racemase
MRRIACLIFISLFSISVLAQIKKVAGSNPIGVFDSGTGGLTVLEAMLTLDAFNNETGKPGADGKLDFINEYYQYLADQANMPYGNYAAENKTDLLKENIFKNMRFFLQNHYSIKQEKELITLNKTRVKIIVLACNTATAYALTDIRQLVKADGYNIPVIGVIDAGSRAALQYQQQHGKGTIGVFATAGTVASNGYPKTLRAMQAQYGFDGLSVISQGGVGLAESIDRDWSFFVDTITKVRNEYKGPSLKNNSRIDTLLMNMYHFDKSYNHLLCEYDDKGKCLDVQLNSPANYVRYHLVSLLEKMISERYTQPMNTLILGCTHYPYLRDTIASVLKELYDFNVDGNYRYKKYLAEHVELIDPALETAKDAYVALRKFNLNNTSSSVAENKFFITIPNTLLSEVKLQPDGWFTYQYKYGRRAGENKNYVRYVPFDTRNISSATYDRFKLVLPHVYGKIIPALDCINCSDIF